MKAGGLKILIDCGLFQGEHKWRSLNSGPFGFTPSEIDCLLLTHAHLDHCGRIPLLYSSGFRGKIICTSATYDIARVILMDSARIQEEDFEHWSRINQRRGVIPKRPLYTTMEVVDCLPLFKPDARYDDPIALNDKVSATFRDSGHILGASFIEIESSGEGRVTFSGDLGNRSKPIIRNPALPHPADVFVLETTYGNRDHKPFDASVDELRRVINDTFRRGGNVVIPSFAVERAQDLLYVLRHLRDEDKIPQCHVYLDSPMAINVTEIMRKHPECFDEETKALFMDEQDDPFDFHGLQFTRSQSASKQINFIKNNAIIIAGSGMCNGGRIRQHLKHNIWRPQSSIVFLGFQAKGTLGRDLVDGAKQVNIFGETFNVNAEVHTIGGFSSHADRSILIEWLETAGAARSLFLVHGEEGALDSFSDEARSRGLASNVIVPDMHKVYPA